MLSSLRKQFPFNLMNDAVIDLPAPVNLSYLWNYGSLLGLCLVIQVVTGVFLSMHYSGHVDLAFSSVIHIMRDVEFGWALRYVHANGSSFFFLFLYVHMGRAMYYGSYKMFKVWNIGVVLYLLVMGIAFMGYVLPWGQMSYWGATVITNLLSAVPYVGKMLVEWVWGGFSVGNATLNRFFTFHFLLPLIVMVLSVVHLVLLHESSSNNPLGIKEHGPKVPFHPFFTSKDVVGFVIFIFLLVVMVCFWPNLLGDPENFVKANPLVTPVHIKPEWYFLWAYAILRSVPNKLGGVVAMFGGIFVLFSLPVTSQQVSRSFAYYPVSQVFFWSFVINFMLLTWIGSRPVEEPYSYLGQFFTIYYFFYFAVSPLVAVWWDNSLNKVSG